MKAPQARVGGPPSTAVPPPPMTGGAMPVSGETGGGGPGLETYLSPVSYANAGAPIAPAEPARLPAAGRMAQVDQPESGEAYESFWDNPFLEALDHPLSTFSIDVDTASYSNVRRFVEYGTLPPPDAVRIEEMLNYFEYDDPPPEADQPFGVSVEVVNAPWKPNHRLVRVGLKGRSIDLTGRPAANLVFLIDVSGSMSPPEKLPLLKQALKLLVTQLGENDRVAIVVYAGASGMVLPPTYAFDQATILEAIERLESGGSTNGGEGIRLAYDTAASGFVAGALDRVILATDGDFNVGITDPGELTAYVTERAREGVFLTVLGFGMGNLKDSTLESLADNGNGHYAYIDSLDEARKVLVEQIGGTLVTIAKDVKIQVEFNPRQVAGYRLIGYENRALAVEDFNNDSVDAGEIGAGHSVTALYEIVPAGSPLDTFAPFPTPTPAHAASAQAGSEAVVDALRYDPATGTGRPGELLTVKLRYKPPDGEVSVRQEYPVVDLGLSIEQGSPDTAFAAAVATLGMLLRDSPYRGDASFDMARQLADIGKSVDARGYRTQFASLVDAARGIAGGSQPQGW